MCNVEMRYKKRKIYYWIVGMQSRKIRGVNLRELEYDRHRHHHGTTGKGARADLQIGGTTTTTSRKIQNAYAQLRRCAPTHLA